MASEEELNHFVLSKSPLGFAPSDKEWHWPVLCWDLKPWPGPPNQS